MAQKVSHKWLQCRTNYKRWLTAMFILSIIVTCIIMFRPSKHSNITPVNTISKKYTRMLEINDSPPTTCLYNDSIILVVISCARWDQLSKTIDSFEKYNTYNCLKRKIVMEDCTDIKGMNQMAAKYKSFGYEFYATTTP
eukprot:497564_1